MSNLLYEIRDDGVATITLNRPERLNAFTHAMIDLWVEALHDAQHNDAVQVVVVTGAGRAFCSGGDVGGMNERSPDMTGPRPQALARSHPSRAAGARGARQAGDRGAQRRGRRRRTRHGADV